MKGRKKNVEPDVYIFERIQNSSEAESVETKITGPSLIEYLDAIYFTKKTDIVNDENEKFYNPFIINKMLSANIDTLFHAQELNQYLRISKQAHFRLALHSIPKKKRYGKFMKHIKDKRLEVIKEYYNCSTFKAKEVLKMLKPEQLNFINEYLDKGGGDVRQKSIKNNSMAD